MKEVEDMTHKKLQGLGKEAQYVFFPLNFLLGTFRNPYHWVESIEYIYIYAGKLIKLAGNGPFEDGFSIEHGHIPLTC